VIFLGEVSCWGIRLAKLVVRAVIRTDTMGIILGDVDEFRWLTEIWLKIMIGRGSIFQIGIIWEMQEQRRRTRHSDQIDRSFRVSR